MDHSFLIQSSVEGHLGSFQSLAIVDIAAMNIGVHMALLFTMSVSLEMPFNRQMKMWSIYTMEYYSAIRKNDYPTFAATWMGLEEIMLSEISQAEKDNYHMVSLIYGT